MRAFSAAALCAAVCSATNAPVWMAGSGTAAGTQASSVVGPATINREPAYTICNTTGCPWNASDAVSVAPYGQIVYVSYASGVLGGMLTAASAATGAVSWAVVSLRARAPLAPPAPPKALRPPP